MGYREWGVRCLYFSAAYNLTCYVRDDNNLPCITLAIHGP